MNQKVIKDQPLEVFGHWQTELYMPPAAVDGKVPRNEYGNVELFKPWMLPPGTTHLPVPGLSRDGSELEALPRLGCAVFSLDRSLSSVFQTHFS